MSKHTITLHGRSLALYADGGGYVAVPDNIVLDGVPPQNVIALYNEVGSLRQ